MSQQFRNIVYLSDTSGTGMWRRIWIENAIECIQSQLNLSVTHSQHPVLDQNFYNGMTSVHIQRWINTPQKDLILKFIKPLLDAHCGWLVYEIDDNMSDKCIPLFNRGRKAFEGEEIQNNIRTMLNAADFVTVTTDYIKQFYHKHYGVPLENILAIPNLLPKYLFGDRYDVERKKQQFIANKNRPRIGIVSSLSHFNVDGTRIDKNGLACRLSKKPDGTDAWLNENNEEVKFEDTEKITDDFDDIANVIRETINDFQWVCFGYCPPQVKDLADKNKIEVHGGQPIMNYASKLENLNLQAIIAPIKQTEFNFCKSHIKTMECAAIGVPLFATNCLPYSRVMPADQLFNDQNDLKEKLIKLKFRSTGSYVDIIENQWKWLNSPCKEGDFNLKNYWLEDNLNIWLDLYRLRQKTLDVSMTSFIEQYEAKQAEIAKKIIAKSESGEATITL